MVLFIEAGLEVAQVEAEVVVSIQAVRVVQQHAVLTSGNVVSQVQDSAVGIDQPRKLKFLVLVLRNVGHHFVGFVHEKALAESGTKRTYLFFAQALFEISEPHCFYTFH